MVNRQRKMTDPTPEEIQRLCDEIRGRWSEDTRRTRAGFQKDRNGQWQFWSVPEYNRDNLPFPPSTMHFDAN